MKYSQILLLACLFLLITAFKSDKKENVYPKDYFRSPVDFTIKISGTFGELRPNHFHAGIDIKSPNGKVGATIYSVADGYISRIKIQSGGYGNCLYVTHPNGFTSVYAHLHKLPSNVAAFVKNYQYAQQSFENDIYLESHQFPLLKGQVIGKMGNSGNSFGPHLHFEIRDSYTEEPIDPLLFNIPVKDNIPPKLQKLKIYYLNDKQETIGSKEYNIVKGKYNYYVSDSDLDIPAWRAGFAIKTYDFANGTSNWNGPYSIELLEDSSSIFKYEIEKFSFDETRYLNAHIDYKDRRTKKSYYHRCFRLPGNQLQAYKHHVNNGVVELSQYNKKELTFVVKDTKGNTSTVAFKVSRSEKVQAPKKIKDYTYLFPYNEPNYIENNSLQLYFPQGILYENLYLNYYPATESSNNLYSTVHHIGDDLTPLHTYFEIKIKHNGIPDHLKPKAYLAKCSGSSFRNWGGEWEGDWLKATSKELGEYCIKVDQVKPKITPIVFKSNMKGYSRMTFKITDNIKTSGKANGLSYDAYIDGAWVLFQHDAKTKQITHYFEDTILPGEHQFKLILRDAVGNESVYERNFTR